MRTLAIAAALTGLAGCGAALASDSATTRIEPRPYYGAVVSVEKGVRVYRPLPSHDRIIINPTAAPVYIGVPVVPPAAAPQRR
ncbi:MAG: hypothetical protein NW223_19995 [Hyphomicrobiaceae bacterium]|nr:hypothetical protein [Hyphomicrobiaceae bacterium]